MIISRSHRGGAGEPDMTPMIDVVFLLLIFFLVSSDMAREARRTLELPTEPGAEAREAAAGLIVNIDPDGAIFVGTRAVLEEELRLLALEAARRDPDAMPVLRADRRADARSLNAAVDALRAGGFTSFTLSTAPGRAP